MDFFELVKVISDNDQRLVERRQTHSSTLGNWKCPATLLLLAIPDYFASLFVLSDFDCFPVNNKIMPSVADMDLILLYPWQIEDSGHHTAIGRFAESGTGQSKLASQSGGQYRRTYIDFRFLIFGFDSGLYASSGMGLGERERRA
jgi:hypothetical protein